METEQRQQIARSMERIEREVIAAKDALGAAYDELHELPADSALRSEIANFIKPLQERLESLLVKCSVEIWSYM